LRRPRRKRGFNLLAASAQHPNAVQTLNPTAGQRARIPEHAKARVLPVGFAADLLIIAKGHRVERFLAKQILNE